MIGIICAMSLEADAIRASLSDTRTETISGVEFTVGNWHGKEIVLAICGVGKVFAAVCTEAMILRFAPSLILNSGVAGTLIDSISVGDIAISRSLVQHDMNTTALGDPLGMVSGINKTFFEADPEAVRALRHSAERLGLNYAVGTIASGDLFMAKREKKDRLLERFGAIACEMEGAAVAQVAYINRVPFAVLRAISDSASGRAEMEYGKFAPLAASRTHALLDDFIEHLPA